MLLSDWPWFLDKTIIALSGGHFEYFFRFYQNIHACLWSRRAMIEGFDEPIYYGVHGGIKRFYKVEPEKEHAATLDHIVAATAA